jgi:hypothetical protein
MLTDISIGHIFLKSYRYAFVIHILWYNFFLLYLPYYNKNIIYKEKKKIIIFYYFIDVSSRINSWIRHYIYIYIYIY